MRTASLVAMILAVGSPVLASPGIDQPYADSAVTAVHAAWAPDASGARRYPVLVAYDGAIAARSARPGVFAQDSYGKHRRIALSELSPEVAPDATLRARARGFAVPTKVDVAKDFGASSFRRVSTGSDVVFGQGAVHDAYFWGMIRAGSPAVDGNVNMAYVLNQGMSVTFPGRPRSSHEGSLVWESHETSRNIRSRAFDPTTGAVVTGDVVVGADMAYLKADGGDVSKPAVLRKDIRLPDDVTIRGAFAIHPYSIPGVAIEVSISRDASVPAGYTFSISASPEPGTPWLESRTAGPIREWMFDPLLFVEGTRRGVAHGASVHELFLRPGEVLSALDAEGMLRTIGPRSTDVVVRIETLAGRHSVSIDELGPQRPRTPGVTQEHGDAAPPGAQADIRSAEVRGLMPEGAARARLGTRDEVPILRDIVAGGIAFGDAAVPWVSIEGRRQRVRWDDVEAFQVSLYAFGGPKARNFHGSQIYVQMLVRADPVYLEFGWQVYEATTQLAAQLYTVDVHPVESGDHVVDVDWYARAPGDRFRLGADIPIEVAISSEGGGGGVQSGPQGSPIEYAAGVPGAISDNTANGPVSLQILITDSTRFPFDPLANVDGEELRGDLAYYHRQHIAGPPVSVFPRGMLSLGPPLPLL